MRDAYTHSSLLATWNTLEFRRTWLLCSSVDALLSIVGGLWPSLAASRCGGALVAAVHAGTFLRSACTWENTCEHSNHNQRTDTLCVDTSHYGSKIQPLRL